MEPVSLAILALAILAYGLVSGRLEGSPITSPMVFCLIGFLAAQHGLGWIEVDLEEPLIHLLTELTLVLVLFSDAARIDLRILRRDHDLPVRLLSIGLPLTVLAGIAVGWWLFPAMGFWAVALLAAILTPTDAALGQAVVSDSRVPVRVRQALNVESGLNDGIALPVVLIFLSLCHASAGTEGGDFAFWIRFVALQVILGPLVGIGVAWLGSQAIRRGGKAGWVSHGFQHLAVMALAFLAFGGAEVVGGNGFIAAFCAGLTLGNTARKACSSLLSFAEEEGQLLTLLVFFVFGAVLLPEALEAVSGRTLLYGFLSLTVVRVIPVALSLLGKGLRPATVLFLGWFGPRGLASVLFAFLVVDSTGIPGSQELMAVVMVTVALSILLHGLTAAPAAGAYARLLESRGELSEHREVRELPLRVGRGD